MEALSFDFHSVGTIHSKLSTDITISAKCSFHIFYPQFIFVGKKLQWDEWKKIFSYLLNFDISGSFSATEVPNFSFTCLIFFFLVQTPICGGQTSDQVEQQLISTIYVLFVFHQSSLSICSIFLFFCSIVTLICVLSSFLIC